MTSDNGADDRPPGAALPAPAAALPGGPDGAGPFPPPPPCRVGDGLTGAGSAPDRTLRASARLVGTDRASGDVTVPGDDVRAISAAGAPLVRIAAINEGGGAARPSVSVVCEVGSPMLGAAAPREALDVADSTGGATGGDVDVEDTGAAAGAAGSVAAAFELEGTELTAAGGAAFVSVTVTVTGPAAGARAGAGTTAGGAGTAAGAGEGATTVAGAGAGWTGGGA